MLHHILLLLALLPTVLSVYLTAFSTTTHFPCAGTSCPPHSDTLPSSTLSSLLTSLTTGTSTAPDLPLHQTFASPQLSLFIHAPPSDPSSVLQALSTATASSSPSSFISPTEPLYSQATHTLSDLVSLAANPAQLLHESSRTLHLTINYNDVPQLLSAIRQLTPNLNRGLVVLWSSKQVAGNPPEAPNGDPEAPKPEDPVGADTAPKDGDTPNVMLPPEIESAQLVGLLVALVFLLIFVPGFLCLSRIQPPQTFEVFDSNDAKKKMQ